MRSSFWSPDKRWLCHQRPCLGIQCLELSPRPSFLEPRVALEILSENCWMRSLNRNLIIKISEGMLQESGEEPDKMRNCWWSSDIIHSFGNFVKLIFMVDSWNKISMTARRQKPIHGGICSNHILKHCSSQSWTRLATSTPTGRRDYLQDQDDP